MSFRLIFMVFLASAWASAGAKAGAWETEARLNDATRTYFQRLATISGPEDAFRFNNVENPDETARIQRHFLETFPYHYSILRTSKMYPGVTVLPTMSTAATDMAQVRAKGMQAYGIGAAQTRQELTSGRGAHGDDERISEEAFVDLVKFLWNVVVEVGGATAAGDPD